MKIKYKEKQLDLTTTKVMGILNVTPDSFSDGGKFNQLDKALLQVEKMLAEGASLIDIGGESTRPGAPKISLDEELARVIPVIEAVNARFDCWISIDTSKAKVMQEAVYAGASFINDVCALQETDALKVAASLGVPVCLMHMQGKPQTMQEKPQYTDLIREIDAFFVERIASSEKAGIKKENILLDLGFGFGKTREHNYQLLMNMEHFHRHNLPILTGVSRKSMIYSLFDKKPDEVLGATLACATMAVMQGTHIIRVHDVKETVQAVKVIQYMEDVAEQVGVLL